MLFAAATLAQAGAFAPPSVERLSTALDFFGGAKNKAAKSSPLAGASTGELAVDIILERNDG